MPKTLRTTMILLLSAAVLLSVAGPAGSGLPDAAREGIVADEWPERPTVRGLRAHHNQLRDGDGRVVRLRGVNVAGAEYACLEGLGFFDTPDGRAPTEKAVAAMSEWGANTVRIPLNEQCWLGLDSVGPANSAYAGKAYRAEIRTLVDRLADHDMYAILDLHRSAPGDARSMRQEEMPDRDHSPAFWASVAREYAGVTSVGFDLFNEPDPYGEVSERAWRCWRDGGCTLTSTNSGQPYVAAGMNELVRAVRETGSRHVLFAGGLRYAEVLDGWLKHRPDDPIDQLGASFHGYSFNADCADRPCYDAVLGPIVAEVPLLAGEIGPALSPNARGDDPVCARSSVTDGPFAHTLLDWLDAHGASYTPWAWNPWPDCWALTEDWSGTPTPIWGEQVRARLRGPG